MDTITVGIDGSESSHRALAWAAKAAVARHAPLAILGASPLTKPPVAFDDVAPQDFAPQAEQITKELLREAETGVRDQFPGLECSTMYSPQSPATALVDASRRASLVVVGSRGHGGFHDLLLGSTSLHTAMHAHCPVVVVRPVTPGEGGAAGRIVVGVDASAYSQAALKLAFAEAELSGKPVMAVHAYATAITYYPTELMPQIPDPSVDRGRAEDLLARELLPWQGQHPNVEVEAIVVQATASAALVQRSQGAHLVVVGSRGLGGFSAAILGSVGHALIHHARCPVLIAREIDGDHAA